MSEASSSAKIQPAQFEKLLSFFSIRVKTLRMIGLDMIKAKSIRSNLSPLMIDPTDELADSQRIISLDAPPSLRVISEIADEDRGRRFSSMLDNDKSNSNSMNKTQVIRNIKLNRIKVLTENLEINRYISEINKDVIEDEELLDLKELSVDQAEEEDHDIGAFEMNKSNIMPKKKIEMNQTAGPSFFNSKKRGGDKSQNGSIGSIDPKKLGLQIAKKPMMLQSMMIGGKATGPVVRNFSGVETIEDDDEVTEVRISKLDEIPSNQPKNSAGQNGPKGKLAERKRFSLNIEGKQKVQRNNSTLKSIQEGSYFSEDDKDIGGLNEGPMELSGFEESFNSDDTARHKRDTQTDGVTEGRNENQGLEGQYSLTEAGGIGRRSGIPIDDKKPSMTSNMVAMERFSIDFESAKFESVHDSEERSGAESPSFDPKPVTQTSDHLVFKAISDGVAEDDLSDYTAAILRQARRLVESGRSLCRLAGSVFEAPKNFRAIRFWWLSDTFSSLQLGWPFEKLRVHAERAELPLRLRRAMRAAGMRLLAEAVAELKAARMFVKAWPHRRENFIAVLGFLLRNSGKPRRLEATPNRSTPATGRSKKRPSRRRAAHFVNTVEMLMAGKRRQHLRQAFIRMVLGVGTAEPRFLSALTVSQAYDPNSQPRRFSFDPRDEDMPAIRKGEILTSEAQIEIEGASNPRRHNSDVGEMLDLVDKLAEESHTQKRKSNLKTLRASLAKMLSSSPRMSSDLNQPIRPDWNAPPRLSNNSVEEPILSVETPSWIQPKRISTNSVDSGQPLPSSWIYKRPSRISGISSDSNPKARASFIIEQDINSLKKLNNAPDTISEETLHTQISLLNFIAQKRLKAHFRHFFSNLRILQSQSSKEKLSKLIDICHKKLILDRFHLLTIQTRKTSSANSIGDLLKLKLELEYTLAFDAINLFAQSNASGLFTPHSFKSSRTLTLDHNLSFTKSFKKSDGEIFFSMMEEDYNKKTSHQNSVANFAMPASQVEH